MGKKIKPKIASVKEDFPQYVGEIYLSGRDSIKGIPCDPYTSFITEFETNSIETKFLEKAIRDALAKKKTIAKIKRQLEMDNEAKFYCSVHSEDGEVWHCEIDQKGKLLGKPQIGLEKTVFKSSTFEELFIDRFGVYEIFRHKTEKEAKIEGDYPPFVGYQDSQRFIDPVIVEILVKYDLKNIKDEFFDDLPIEIKSTPVHHIRYYVEKSLLDRFLTHMHYGAITPEASIEVAHINNFDDTPKCRKIREILTSNFARVRGKVIF